MLNWHSLLESANKIDAYAVAFKRRRFGPHRGGAVRFGLELGRYALLASVTAPRPPITEVRASANPGFRAARPAGGAGGPFRGGSA